MKMGPGLFWGILLIVCGLSIILKIFFDISFFRIIIASVIILIGIKMLIGKSMHNHFNNNNHVVFSERSIKNPPTDGAEYSTVFGKSVYDFRDTNSFTDDFTRVEVNTVFGETEIILPTNINVEVKTDAVFSAATMPNGNSISFGNTVFKSEASDSNSMKTLKLEAHVVFGNLKIRQDKF